MVQKRTADDHVGWLMEHEKYEDALTMCEESPRDLKAHSVEVCVEWGRKGSYFNCECVAYYCQQVCEM